ncbi:MAG: ATP synthase F1 subunit epsilon [Planctomycetota bacterium]|jgi:F-type H+-transporting ATPase subunit epsilon
MAEVKHPLGSLSSRSIADELALPPGILQVKVVSPQGPVYEDQARWVTVRAWNGQMGIWPRHAELVAALGAGLLRIGHPDGRMWMFAVWGGFLRVGNGMVTILVDRAAGADEVDEAAAKRDLDLTLEALRHPRSDEEFAELLEKRRWCQSRLRLVR